MPLTTGSLKPTCPDCEQPLTTPEDAERGYHEGCGPALDEADLAERKAAEGGDG